MNRTPHVHQTGAPFAPIRLSGGRLQASILPFGAILTDLRLDGWPNSLVLGLERPGDYAGVGHLYLGAVIGRMPNRIAHGRARINGELHEFECNVPPHHVHGGSHGFSTQVWTVEQIAPDRIVLALQSPDGAGGYPGKINVRTIYECIGDATLRLTFTATTTRPTIFGMCHHPYFNLDGRNSVAEHDLTIFADHSLPEDNTMLPTGEIRNVTGSEHDFRTAVRLGAQLNAGVRYNRTFCLHALPAGPLKLAATLISDSGPSLELWTTQPGLHFYSGHKLRSDLAEADGRTLRPFAGLCLEAQNWPNSPNVAGFPSTILTPHSTYLQTTEYRFRMN